MEGASIGALMFPLSIARGPVGGTSVRRDLFVAVDWRLAGEGERAERERLCPTVAEEEGKVWEMACW